jgi:tetratricopeptide (TPR) repeat protein
VDGVATEATLIPTVQTLVRQARSRLGERRSSIEAALPLDQVATPSFPAYRKYAEGLRLQARGDGVGSNRLMREALALDTGFASAWFSMGWNYQNERMMDSARWAFSQAMARRSRLSDAQRYRLEADAAYAIDYDIAGAIRAYDLYLTTTPGSWAGHNNRGNYLIALGRYEDALESFERAVKAHPFGPQRAQIQVMNQAATLIALGRLADAERLARDLDGHFGTYIRLMRGAAADDWDGVDSLARLTATAPSTPAWLRVPAVAITAGARARRGAVRSADSLLSAGGASASPDAARWFFRARLLLAHAAGVPVPPVPASLRRDVSPTAIITVGLGAAMRGDTVAARTALAGIARADSVELKRLGHGPALIEAWIAARAGNWDRVLDLIGPAARQGEHDTSLLDRVGSQSLRLLAADALAATGRTREFEEMMALLLLPQRMSGNEFALRGLTASFAQLRLARALHRQQRTREADEHRRAAAAVLREPDPDVARIWADVLSQTAR